MNNDGIEMNCICDIINEVKVTVHLGSSEDGK